MTDHAPIVEAWLYASHDRVCHLTHETEDYRVCAQRWAVGMYAAPCHAAIDHLLAHPRDARGARLILHDGHCMSGCTGKQRDEHAGQWAGNVAALRHVLKESRPGVSA